MFKWLLIIFLVIIVVVWFKHDIKVLHFPDVSMVTGGVKTGKTLLCVREVIHDYRIAVIGWALYRFTLGLIPKYTGQNRLLRRLFKGKTLKPVLYSNIPLMPAYCPLRLAHIQRTERLVDGSVVLIDEASLLADSMSFKLQSGEKVNTKTKEFFKLFGHECGGKCIINTQSIRDVHYNIKRSCCSYLWIERNVKIPFFVLCKVREMIFLDDTTVNTFDSDVDDSTKWIIIPKLYYYRYDKRCYSVQTDNLPVGDITMIRPKSLKQFNILSFDNLKNKENIK